MLSSLQQCLLVAVTQAGLLYFPLLHFMSHFLIHLKMCLNNDNLSPNEGWTLHSSSREQTSWCNACNLQQNTRSHVTIRNTSVSSFKSTPPPPPSSAADLQRRTKCTQYPTKQFSWNFMTRPTNPPPPPPPLPHHVLYSSFLFTMNRFNVLSLSLHHPKRKILSPLCVSYMLGRGTSKPIRDKVSENPLMNFGLRALQSFPSCRILSLPSLLYVHIQSRAISAEFATSVLLQVQMSCM